MRRRTTPPKYPLETERPAILLNERRRKMARSAHAYVRGATAKFYEWLEQSQGHAIPDGPPLWICGDCHLGNLGPVADAGGRVSIQIRDLDQTVIGNPAHDLIRLGLSLATAARSSLSEIFWTAGSRNLKASMRPSAPRISRSLLPRVAWGQSTPQPIARSPSADARL